jgi:hypothetical protein
MSTYNVDASRIDEQTLETLQLAVKHFTQQDHKGSFILALVADYLKIDLTHEVVAEVKQFVHQFNDDERISSKLGSLELTAAKVLGLVKEQQAVQITIAAPPQLPDVNVERRQLVPEWE